jgi:hypothetical protein
MFLDGEHRPVLLGLSRTTPRIGNSCAARNISGSIDRERQTMRDARIIRNPFVRMFKSLLRECGDRRFSAAQGRLQCAYEIPMIYHGVRAAALRLAIKTIDLFPDRFTLERAKKLAWRDTDVVFDRQTWPRRMKGIIGEKFSRQMFF